MLLSGLNVSLLGGVVMHKIQRQLHTDHHHLHKLLNCLSHEIGCYDFDSKRAPDLAIILSALDYVRTYPDKWHHPSEDIIFNRLLKKKVKERKMGAPGGKNTEKKKIKVSGLEKERTDCENKTFWYKRFDCRSTGE